MGADPVPLWSAYIQITCMGKPQVGTPVNHSAGNCCCRSSIFFRWGNGNRTVRFRLSRAGLSFPRRDLAAFSKLAA